MTKKALGKGLKAFLPEDYRILKDEQLVELELDQLKPNPLQPRKVFNPASLDELSRSIRETGVLQPIIAVPEDDHYKIIVGERRWRAAQKIGLTKIPVLIRNLSSQQQLEASLIENLQREDLNPIEIGGAYKKLMKELSLTQQEVAERVGKDRASVANYVRLLKLPQEIQDHLADGKLSMGHARTLITLEDPSRQLSSARQIIKQGLSVRDVEKLIQRLKSGPREKKERPIDPDLQSVQEALLKHLGTKVTIAGSPAKGIIKIHYFSVEELNSIFEKIKGA